MEPTLDGAGIASLKLGNSFKNEFEDESAHNTTLKQFDDQEQ